VKIYIACALTHVPRDTFQEYPRLIHRLGAALRQEGGHEVSYALVNSDPQLRGDAPKNGRVSVMNEIGVLSKSRSWLSRRPLSLPLDSGSNCNWRRALTSRSSSVSRTTHQDVRLKLRMRIQITLIICSRLEKDTFSNGSGIAKHY